MYLQSGLVKAGFASVSMGWCYGVTVLAYSCASCVFVLLMCMQDSSSFLSHLHIFLPFSHFFKVYVFITVIIIDDFLAYCRVP
jgi:hypothetical protein